MTENEWLSSNHPLELSEWWKDNQASERKLRLFLAACARAAWPQAQSLIEMAEGLAEGTRTRQEADKLQLQECPSTGDAHPRWCPYRACEEPYQIDLHNFFSNWTKCNLLTPIPEAVRLLHCIAGNPFQPRHEPWTGPLDLNRLAEDGKAHRSLMAWQDGLVPRLAEAAYQERTKRVCQDCWPTAGSGKGHYNISHECKTCHGSGSIDDGWLDPARLGVLADALEDAGCDDTSMLEHLREPGPHARGCWVVDLLTGRS
jgi:hypothetical protein